MMTLEAWIEGREHVDIKTLASEDRSCGICYKNHETTAPKVKTALKDEEREGCIAPVKLTCGHIMGSTCLLKWLKPYPFGTNSSEHYSLGGILMWNLSRW